MQLATLQQVFGFPPETGDGGRIDDRQAESALTRAACRCYTSRSDNGSGAYMLHSWAVIKQRISVYQRGVRSSVSAQAASCVTRNITQWMHCVCNWLFFCFVFAIDYFYENAEWRYPVSARIWASHVFWHLYLRATSPSEHGFDTLGKSWLR